MYEITYARWPRKSRTLAEDELANHGVLEIMAFQVNFFNVTNFLKINILGNTVKFHNPKKTADLFKTWLPNHHRHLPLRPGW